MGRREVHSVGGHREHDLTGIPRGAAPRRRTARAVPRLPSGGRGRNRCDPRRRGTDPLAAPRTGSALAHRLPRDGHARRARRRITDFVLDEAVAQCAEWRLRGHGRSRVGERFGPPRSPARPARRSRRGADQYGIPPSHLTVEITEHACSFENGELRDTFTTLARMGVRLSLDDFGMVSRRSRACSSSSSTR